MKEGTMCKTAGAARMSMPPHAPGVHDLQDSAARNSSAMSAASSVKSSLSSTSNRSLGWEELSLSQIRFSELDRLYGRDEEVRQLREVYERVLQRTRLGGEERGRSYNDRGTSSRVSPELVLIAGYSGTGKSAVAEQLRRTVRRTGGFFISGKFDLQKRAEPYTAFIAAFEELCVTVLSLERTKPSSAAKLRRAVSEAVGSEENVLTDIVPSLRRLIEEENVQDNNDALNPAATTGAGGYLEAKNRFNLLLRKFLRAVSSPSIPVVLFLDDLQWADAASLELLETLVVDRENPSLMLLGCYRENEVDRDTHPLAVRLREIEMHNITITKIHVGNLHVDVVNELTAHILSFSTSSATRELADIVHRRTHGNVFFVIQFLKALRDEGLLTYCFGTLRWRWDKDAIEAGTTVTNNVVDLMSNKMRRQSLGVQKALQIAACLGFSFEAEAVSLVMEVLRKNNMNTQGADDENEQDGVKTLTSQTSRVADYLDTCLTEGLLEKEQRGVDGPLMYRFVHDQVQLAAYSLIGDEEQDQMQFHIGEILVENSTPAELERNIFVAVDLLDRGLAFVSSSEVDKRERLAKLYLRAGERAMETSAFVPAATYLKTGISLLGPNYWKTNYELSLKLFSASAEAEYCNGNFKQMKCCVDEILAQDGPLNDKFRAYFVLMDSLGAQNKLSEAMDAARQVLALLGVRFPKAASKFVIIADFIKTKRLLKGRDIMSLSNLPIMEDEMRTNAMQILTSLATFVYLAAKEDLFPLIVFRMVRWTIRYGICKHSAAAFSAYGLILCGILGDLKRGNEYGQLALSLLKRLDAKDMESRNVFVVNYFISHWVTPVQLTLKEFVHGYQVGMEYGDIDNAMLNLVGHSISSLNVGRPLSQVEADLRNRSQQMRDHGQDVAAALLTPVLQFVLNLMGHSRDPIILTGEVMDQNVILSQMAQTKDDRQAFYTVKTYQLWLAYYFGSYELAWQLVNETSDFEKVFASLPGICRYAFVAGLVSLALAGKTKKTKFKKYATRYMSKLKKWAKNGNVNCVHMVHLLEGEKAGILKEKNDIVRGKYDLAISVSSRMGLVQDKALANQRAGMFFARIGDEYWASQYLGRAHQLYVDWGAHGVANHLLARHSGLLKRVDSLHSPE